MSEYAAFVMAMLKSGEQMLEEMSAEDAELLHAGVLIAGESAELLDAIKKTVIYKKPIDRENIIEELGDIEFSLEVIRTLLVIDRKETIDQNIKKLMKRRPSGSYNNEDSIRRLDKEET